MCYGKGLASRIQIFKYSTTRCFLLCLSAVDQQCEEARAMAVGCDRTPTVSLQTVCGKFDANCPTLAVSIEYCVEMPLSYIK